MKKLVISSLILLSLVISGYRGSGRDRAEGDKEKQLKSTILQRDVSIVVDDIFYQFKAGTACSVFDSRNIGHGAEEYITVEGVSFWTSASTCD